MKRTTFTDLMMMLFINKIRCRMGGQCLIRPILTIVLFILLVYLFVSCSAPNIYDKNISVDTQGWNFKDRVVFEALIEDTLQPINFFLNIRHNTDYEFANLFLFLHTTYPTGQHSTDTLEILLAAADGKWLGKGFGKIKEDRVLLKKGVYFPLSGTYTFSIEQAMREEILTGIEDVGITIQKMQD